MGKHSIFSKDSETNWIFLIFLVGPYSSIECLGWPFFATYQPIRLPPKYVNENHCFQTAYSIFPSPLSYKSSFCLYSWTTIDCSSHKWICVQNNWENVSEFSLKIYFWKLESGLHSALDLLSSWIPFPGSSGSLMHGYYMFFLALSCQIWPLAKSNFVSNFDLCIVNHWPTLVAIRF